VTGAKAQVGSGGPISGQLARGQSAFSLIELLVVAAIIVVMASLMGPTLTTVTRGTALTRGADTVIGILSAARQAAVTKGQTVEVRFYCYTDPEMPGDTPQYRALQAFTIDDSGNATPMFKSKALPQTVVMATNSFGGTSGSSLLNLINSTAPGSVSIPRVGNAYTCSSFRFFRGGTTSLLTGGGGSSSWCVTVVNSSDLLGAGAANLPTNFTTVVIDPYNGSIRPFRPTL
jgi:uncharacterized protein (TIGR02596 family)